MKSFTEILEHLPDIVTLLDGHERYWAHIHLWKKEELLAEHIALVNDYACKLVDTHGLNFVIDSLLTTHVKGWEQEALCAEVLKECFVAAIVFHDFGKINENFQVLRMQNRNAFAEKKDTVLNPAHGHSKLGAFLYICYFAEKVFHLPLSNEQRVILFVFASLLGYSIMQHHSPVLLYATQREGYLGSFKGLFNDLKEYGKVYGFVVDEDLLDDVFESCEDCWQENVLQSFFIHDNYKPFPFFALIKLNFSLLTAADYLATHHYSSSSADGNEAATTDFGVFTTRQRIQETAAHLQSYRHNTAAFLNVSNYIFSHPTNRSNANLNKLREEMAVEVIQTIRKNVHHRLFYLEAPTGGGKTNLSAIASTELLLGNPELNKIYYVFPFTTLITQTFGALKDSMHLGYDEITELHSKAGLASKQDNIKEQKMDGIYFNNQHDSKKDYVDNLFALYPVTLLSHVKFFDVLKTNGKEANYLLHRLANSVVIVDELQSYNPKLWDKMLFFISEYAVHFNIRFVLMSATLPKISGLKTGIKNVPDFIDLLPNSRKYILNPNFSTRVKFNFTLYDKGIVTIEQLAETVLEKSANYANDHGNVKTVVEFIFKKSASEFLHQIKHSHLFDKVFLLSGTVLEPRRKEIINYIKQAGNAGNILLITTQVVEAGVDIDMDLGFKNTSLIDSDEQLAGRVNRNASKESCEVYLFKMDDASVLYGADYRYKKTAEEIDNETYQDILKTKDFSSLYNKVIGYIDGINNPIFKGSIRDYTDALFHFDYPRVDKEFKIIAQESATVFVPLCLPVNIDGVKFDEQDLVFSSAETDFRAGAKIYANEGGYISGEDIWQLYESLIDKSKQHRKDKGGFDIQQKINFKRLQSIMSKFSFSLMDFSSDRKELKLFGEEKYGYLYLHHWNEDRGDGEPYTYKNGLNNKAFKTSNFI